MVLKLHGNPLSTCTKRVQLALEEKGVPYEIVPVDLSKGEQKTEAFLEKQPFGKVPFLEDNGFFVYESRAIAQYIASKYRGQGIDLAPAESQLKEYALFQQAVSVEQSYFDPLVSGIAYEKLFKSMKGEGAPDEAKIAALVTKLEGVLAGYERILSKQRYLAGDTLTLADLFHLPYATLVETLGYKDTFAKYPAFAKWLAELQGRESWKKINAK
ncbi:hypothetical protein VTN77DRAFT_5975 [Rasamsonia byssochlamydoides]|uniref:uncharacterized protein n=1 Tax=Rasamsonia byssochlamydoides TaxID=89139 RepID=UPI00374480FB